MKKIFLNKIYLIALLFTAFVLVFVVFHKAPAQSFDQGNGFVIISSNKAGNFTIPITITGIDANTGALVNSENVTVDFTASEPPSCSSFVASPQKLVIPPSASSKLSWSCANTMSCSISPTVGAVNPASGSATVSPATTTVYTLSCYNSAGQSAAYTTTVTVFSPTIKEE